MYLNSVWFSQRVFAGPWKAYFILLLNILVFHPDRDATKDKEAMENIIKAIDRANGYVSINNCFWPSCGI